MHERSDEELIALYKLAPTSPSGRAAVDEVFRRYQARVALWCWRATGNRERAADLAQDVFLKVLRNLDSFRGDSKFSTWLYVVTRNLCFSELRSHAVRSEDALDLEETDFAASDPAVDQELIQREGQTLMRRWMAERLDEDERKVMMLHYGEELALDAITALLGLKNRSGAKAFIVSARRKLEAAVAELRHRNASGRNAGERR